MAVIWSTFECIAVNKEKLWNFNAHILVFVLYLGCTSNLVSVTYLEGHSDTEQMY